MRTIHAIYENGVFRPVEPVDLPDQTTVEFEPRIVSEANGLRGSDAVYAILAKRYVSGDAEGAARHDEHQP